MPLSKLNPCSRTIGGPLPASSKLQPAARYVNEAHFGTAALNIGRM